MRITVLAGGVGGARFLLGVKAWLGWDPTGPAPDDADDQITAIVNTGDDIRLHNLQICPDLDSCLYTLSGAADTERGWGRAGETWTVSRELTGYGAEAPWFSLGDKDIATHLVRTRMLDAGYPLSEVTQALCDRWMPGVRLLPMTDNRVETHVVVVDPERATGDVNPDEAAGGSDFHEAADAPTSTGRSAAPAPSGPPTGTSPIPDPIRSRTRRRSLRCTSRSGGSAIGRRSPRCRSPRSEPRTPIPPPACSRPSRAPTWC